MHIEFAPPPDRPDVKRTVVVSPDDPDALERLFSSWRQVGYAAELWREAQAVIEAERAASVRRSAGPDS